MRSRPRIALLAAACALVAAAGAAASGGTSETVQLNSADQAMARRIALQKADVGPGWARDGAGPAESSDSLGGSSSSRNAGCDVGVDLAEFTITGGYGADYKRKGAFVGSSVIVFPTTADATGDLAANMSPAARKCFVEQIGSAFAAEARKGNGGVVHFEMGATKVIPSASYRSFHASHVYAFLFTGRMVGPGGSIPISVVMLAFSKGRIISTLFGVSVSEHAMQMSPLAKRMLARFPGNWTIAP